MCKGTHNIYQCAEFLKLPVQSRIQEVQKHKLCFNCLRTNHLNKDCTSGHCKKCSKKHNTLLHREETTSQDNSSKANASEATSGSQEDTNSKVSCNHTSKMETPVILATALVSLRDSQGNQRDCRALLDGGAQSHFITQDLCDQMKLKLIPINQSVAGLGKQPTNLNYKTEIILKSRCNAFSAKITCLVIQRITGELPNSTIERANLKIPQNLRLADPQFHTPRAIDLFIGAELFWSLLCVGQISLGPSLPIMQKTRLGWVLGGPMTLPTSRKDKAVRHCQVVTTQQLHDQVARFWELEECRGSQAIKERPEDLICKEHFKTTTTRNEEGRFVVSIPFKEQLRDLGESKEQAHRRLLAIERRLKGNSAWADEYRRFMYDYEALGHMSKIAVISDERKGAAYYLPHHAVSKESSTTTKVRVVFDGSAKTSSGLSINDVQYVGPVVQEDLFSILIRFRRYRFVISADIKQMYRQVLIREDQRKYQCVLWRDSDSSDIYEYQLNTLTYGMSSAPYLATRALQQIAKDHMTDHPITCEAILRDFYMDDLLSGAESIEEAKNLKQTLSDLLLQYGFELRKWASNDKRIISSDESEACPLPLPDMKDPRTLGLLWDPGTDTLSFALNIPKHKQFTKRTILSTIASIFDPLGLVASVIVTAKLILQRL